MFKGSFAFTLYKKQGLTSPVQTTGKSGTCVEVLSGAGAPTVWQGVCAYHMKDG